MSPIDSILWIPGLVVQEVKRAQDIHVWAKPQRRPTCVHCAADRVRIKATHRRTLKHTRQGNQLVVLHLSVPKYHCTDCDRYFRHRFAGIRPRVRATETYRLEVFEAHEGGVSQRKLTRTHRIGNATVERWYQSFVKQRVSELAGRSCPQVLGIDEHFFTRKRGYATTLVDLKNHKVFDVVLGRSVPYRRSVCTTTWLKSGASSTVLRQAAIEWILGDEEFEQKAGSEDDAKVPGLARAVRTKSGQGIGHHAQVVARADREDVALHQIQRYHRGLPH